MTLPSYAMGLASFPEMYEQWLVGPLFRPWAEMLPEELRLAPGDRVLDLACGTGIVARVARERLGDSGRIVGIDISSDMLAVACAAAPDIDWREGNAGALPLHAGERFDVVVCQQGLQFFPDKPGAAAQMRGALAPGGRLAVSTWRSDDEIPFFRDLRRMAERHLGPIADERFSFGDAAALETLLCKAGFDQVDVRTVSRSTRLEHAAAFVHLNTMALVGMSAAGRAMGEQERRSAVESIARDSEETLERYADEAGLVFELSTNLATARG